MPRPNIAPSYLRDIAAVQGGNQSTDYFRYQDEIAKQKAELEAQKRKENSFGNRMLRVGGALLPVAGMAAGSVFGGPVGGMIGGGLGSALGSAISPAGTPSNAASSAMMGASMGRYMQGSPAAATSPASMNGASYSQSAGFGNMTPEEYQLYLDTVARGG